MKERYETPVLDLVAFDGEDLICTSPTFELPETDTEEITL